MNQVIQILIGISVLSLPIVVFWIYMTKLEKRTEKIIQDHSDNSSKVYKDLKVWFKNVDVFKKRNKFDIDPYQTLYSYKDCDLILNERNFVVIGKVKILGKSRPLSPTIFEFVSNGVQYKSRHVKIENIKEAGSDLEIEFTDKNYIDKMTLVIKTPENEPKVKMKTGYNRVARPEPSGSG